MKHPNGRIEMDRNLAKVRVAAHDAAKCILPILEIEEGSGGRRHVGSAFVIRAGDRAAFVTAAHVVEGPTRKTVVLSETGKLQRWPTPHGVLIPLGAGIPDADVAYMTGTFTEDTGALKTITAETIATNLAVRPDMSFVAIGYPGSRTRIMSGNQTLRPVTFTGISSPVSPDALAQLGLDPRVHLAMNYDRKKMIGPDGSRMEGPTLKGMSGGGLFVVAANQGADGIELTLLLAGVLIEYRGAPDNVVVATRIDCLLDAISPARPLAERTHIGADRPK
jgi:Trypsin-like peptidase domain